MALADHLRTVHNRAGPSAAPVLARVEIDVAERAREFAALIRTAAALSAPAPSRRALALALRSRLVELHRVPLPVYLDGGTRDGVLGTAVLLYRRVPAVKTILRALSAGT